MGVLEWALQVGLCAVALAMALCAVRLFRGPSVPDRVLALDTLYLNAVALTVLLGMWWGNTLWFEAAVLVAMLGFVSTVALGRYISRGDVVE
jgi:multicomponent K+:H+ antiporter subunit F